MSRNHLCAHSRVLFHSQFGRLPAQARVDEEVTARMASKVAEQARTQPAGPEQRTAARRSLPPSAFRCAALPWWFSVSLSLLPSNASDHLTHQLTPAPRPRSLVHPRTHTPAAGGSRPRAAAVPDLHGARDGHGGGLRPPPVLGVRAAHHQLPRVPRAGHHAAADLLSWLSRGVPRARRMLRVGSACVTTQQLHPDRTRSVCFSPLAAVSASKCSAQLFSFRV